MHFFCILGIVAPREMKISKHTTNLAVLLALGVMFFVPLVAKSAQAQTLPQLSPTSLSSTSEYCSYSDLVKVQKTYEAFTMLPYGNANDYLANAIIISEPSDSLLRSVSPAKTVLKKTDGSAQKEEEITITPAPIITQAASGSAPTTQSDSTTTQGGSLSAEKLFALVNAHRASIGLSPFEQDGRVCEVVSSRAPEIENEIYGTSYMHAGFQSRNLPYWATENIISINTEEEALNWWLNSPVHRSAIQGAYKYACLACSGKSCAMVFTNFDPKSAPTTTPSPVLAITQ